LAMCSVLMLYGMAKAKINWSFSGSIAMILVIVLFGMPIAPAITQNPDYRPLSELAQWENETNIKVYEFGGFTPEMVWDFGKPIPGLLRNEDLVKPGDSIYGVLVSQENLNHFKKRFKQDSLQKLTRYDMNPQAPGQRTHRPRLWRDFYLVRVADTTRLNP
jgi:hypothetical protein